LEQIEKLSGYVFIYSNDEIDASMRVTLQVKNEKLETTLEKLFSPLSIAFKVMKNKIILTAEKTAHVQPRKNSAYLVSGLVKDEQGDPLPGVTVMIKGTSSGTSTDASGRYTISVADTISAVLTFSFIGYKTIDIPVNGQTTIDVSLEPSIESLAEVVVVGYSTQKKINVTGAVSTVTSEALENKPVNSVVQALQGTAPNLIIQQQSSEPGAQLNINIRGIGTLGDNSPLIVIDVIPTGCELQWYRRISNTNIPAEAGECL
jgi:hypothetical protein